MDNLEWRYIQYSDIKQLPNKEAIYVFKVISPDDVKILYVGRSNKLKNRLIQHSQFANLLTDGLGNFERLIIAYSFTDKSKEIEKEFISLHKPIHNGNSKNKNISHINNQIRNAMDGRKTRWLSFEVRIPEMELCCKLSGKKLWKDDELKRIEERLSFKIER